MKNTIVYLGTLIFVIVIVGFFLLSRGTNKATGEVVSPNKDAQVVKMHVEGSQYVLEPSTVKKGLPVRIEADMTRMPGCSKSFVISDFNIKKTFSSNNNFVEFTPNKAGTFYIACSMNMYRGNIKVE